MTAARFRAAHGPERLLVLPNIWDAGSARLVEQAGAEAIATSSAAVAWAHGHRDGEDLPFDRLVATVEAIARVVSVPVTVDFEGGYGDDPAAVAAAVMRLIEAGAAGVNLEDGGAPPDLLARKLAAVRAAASTRGVDVFLNARTDVYLRRLVPSEQAAAETLARARLYAGAGSDGLFVPGLTAPADLAAIAGGIDRPLNVMAAPGLAPIAELRRLGVRRLSVGPRLFEAAFAAVRRATVELLEQGTYGALLGEAPTYAELNALFPAR